MKKRQPYAVDTSVPIANTRAEIESILTKFGASSFAMALHAATAVVMFEHGSRRIRFDLALPKAETDAKTAKLHRARWRALLLSIKAKLVSVDTQIETFEEAFLAHVVLANGETVGASVKPALIEQYKTGQMTPLLGYSK